MADRKHAAHHQHQASAPASAFEPMHLQSASQTPADGLSPRVAGSGLQPTDLFKVGQSDLQPAMDGLMLARAQSSEEPLLVLPPGQVGEVLPPLLLLYRPTGMHQASLGEGAG